METLYILDTNVLLLDPKALYAFKGGSILLPMEVIEELDDQKRRNDEVGRNARTMARTLDALRLKGRLSDGVELDNGSVVRCTINSTNFDKLPEGFRRDKFDNRILATALGLQDSASGKQEVVLVTKDVNLRIKASALDINSVDFESNKVDIDELHSGIKTLAMGTDQIYKFLNDKTLDAADMELMVNQFVVLQDTSSESRNVAAKYDAERGLIVPLEFANGEVSGISPRNLEQKFAMEALLDEGIPLVSLVGRAGTGKTLLALAAGVSQVLETQTYARLLITKPIIPLGRDVGFLPGSLQEKLDPWMQPIYDNLDLVFSGQQSDKTSGDRIDYIKDTKLIDVEALTYIRGRSIPRQFILIDEAQNLTPLEAKTIITRAGEGSKVVFAGDSYQIDHPYLDSASNGLNYLVERFKGQRLAAHVTLQKGERSELAELAARLM